MGYMIKGGKNVIYFTETILLSFTKYYYYHCHYSGHWGRAHNDLTLITYKAHARSVTRM